jgi:osmotically-inducible protein OsmY
LAGVAFNACKPDDKQLEKAAATALEKLDATVEVAVKDGVATLSGVVPADTVKTAAEKLITDIKGIQSIENKIEVKIPELSPDEKFANLILEKIAAADPKGKKFNGVTVNVQNGILLLTGIINQSDVKALMQVIAKLEQKPKEVKDLMSKRKF